MNLHISPCFNNPSTPENIFGNTAFPPEISEGEMMIRTQPSNSFQRFCIDSWWIYKEMKFWSYLLKVSSVHMELVKEVSRCLKGRSKEKNLQSRVRTTVFSVPCPLSLRTRHLYSPASINSTLGIRNTRPWSSVTDCRGKRPSTFTQLYRNGGLQ